MDGYSDPYVTVYSKDLFHHNEGDNPSDGACRTDVHWRKLSTCFKSTIGGKVLPQYTTVESLQGKQVTVAVFDFDMITEDDPLGEAVILLDDLIAAYQDGLTLESEDSFRKPVQIDPTSEGENILKINADGLSTFADDVPIDSLLSNSPKKGHSATGTRHVIVAKGEVVFNLPLVCNGRKAGRISGVARLVPITEPVRFSTHRKKKNNNNAEKRTNIYFCLLPGTTSKPYKKIMVYFKYLTAWNRAKKKRTSTRRGFPFCFSLAPPREEEPQIFQGEGLEFVEEDD